MNKRRFLLLILTLFTLAGCSNEALYVHKDDDVYAPPLDYGQTTTTVSGGGLYQNGYNWALMADRRAYRVGDILTIQLDESTQSSKQARTNFGKKNDTSIDAPLAFGTEISKLNASMKANRDFNGSASSQQQNMLRGSITVAVHQVLPNGILVVRGEKWLTLNQGDEYIRVMGLVRAEDIQRDNTISSQRIANARISYSGKGALSESNSAGWLTRFFNHPLFPI